MGLGFSPDTTPLPTSPPEVDDRTGASTPAVTLTDGGAALAAEEVRETIAPVLAAEAFECDLASSGLTTAKLPSGGEDPPACDEVTVDTTTSFFEMAVSAPMGPVTGPWWDFTSVPPTLVGGVPVETSGIPPWATVEAMAGCAIGIISPWTSLCVPGDDGVGLTLDAGGSEHETEHSLATSCPLTDADLASVLHVRGFPDCADILVSAPETDAESCVVIALAGAVDD